MCSIEYGRKHQHFSIYYILKLKCELRHFFTIFHPTQGPINSQDGKLRKEVIAQEKKQQNISFCWKHHTYDPDTEIIALDKKTSWEKRDNKNSYKIILFFFIKWFKMPKEIYETSWVRRLAAEHCMVADNIWGQQ